MGAWVGFEVGVLWGTGFVDADALFGADERAEWMGTEEGVTEVEHAEPEAGFGAGLGSGQAVTGFSEGKPVSDCGFGVGVDGTLTGARHAW